MLSWSKHPDGNVKQMLESKRRAAEHLEEAEENDLSVTTLHPQKEGETD